ncbi:hypothetical protein Q0Z83_031030 [Actinoplanes sichuanensis]|uniref:DUF3592 domain-containing protein n=1 Tax=Actinoplanes sichuanensis TaxID=512349 RepID=A0ABW4ARN3_9ACTN|nr:hypothetical protein [Actinoplanes sichuanensis]BEL04912.1 hypothetical protein Q0Z83_031030 [Actinoplanes sichuanensis]
MPRNRLILRQISLSVGSLSICLSAWAAAGFLAGAGSTVLTVLAVVPMLAGLIVPVLVWFLGEDPRDRHGGWFVAIGAVTLLFAVAAGAGVTGAYLELAGDRVPVVVTAGDDVSGDGYQLVEVAAAATGEDLGEVLFFADRDLRAGDRMVAVFDPLGWFPPATARPSPPRLRYTYALTLTGAVLLTALTAARIRRDLNRYDFTGSRRPPTRTR